MNPANVLAYFAQIAIVVAACAGIPRLVGLRSAAVQHVFWRVVLAVCLLLPVVQPRQPHQMVFVPAPASAAPPPAALPLPAAAGPAAQPIDWVGLAALVILIGISLRVGWIAVGLARLRRLRRRAVEHAAGFEDLRQAIGVGDVPILWSGDTSHPITFGALSPVVLLPSALKSVDRAAQRAVVAHELHHVKRGDWLWTVAEEFVRALFWFHPAMWWLISRVQLARETVVDELSILTTNARRAYLDTLLAFADDTGLQSSTAFSARRHLFHRVMLLSKEGTMSSTRIAVAVFVLAAALAGGTWKAVSAFPLRGGAVAPPLEPQKPPRDPQSPATHHRLAVEFWEKAYNDLSLTPEMRLDVVLKGIEAEDRALAINPEYVPALLQKNVLLRMQANLTANAAEQTRLLTLADELRVKASMLEAPPPPPPPPPPPSEGKSRATRESAPLSFPGPAVPSAEEFERLAATLRPLRIGGTIKQPMKIRDVKPVYPPEAQANKVQGVVIIEGIVDESGTIAAARVLRSIPVFDDAALDAVRQWQFTPTLLNGAPHAVMMTVTVNFSLQ